MPASPFVSSRIPKDGPKKTIDRSQKDKVSRASKRPRTTGSGKHPAAKPEGERCRAHHNAKIANIRARDTPRPHER
jgi:hypothetical protein